MSFNTYMYTNNYKETNMARTSKKATTVTQAQEQNEQDMEVKTLSETEVLVVANDGDTESVVEEKETTDNNPATNKVAKFLKFHKEQLREFLLDDDFVSVQMFKKFDFSFKTSNSIDLVAEKNKIVKAIGRVLSLSKAEDVICSVHDNTELNYDTPNTVYTLFVPYSEKLNIITQNIYRMVDSMNSDSNRVVQYRVKTKGTAKLRINENHNSEKGEFFKGFVATSYEHPVKNEEGVIVKPSTNYLKAGSYIDSNVGLTPKEIGLFNKFNLTLNKIKFFDSSKNAGDADGFDRYLNFKKKFRVITYRIYIDENGQKYALTKVIDVNLKLDNIIQTSDTKVVVGFYLNKETIDGPINGFKDIFIDENGENRMTKYSAIDPNSYEFKTFETEIATIDENILSTVAVVENKESDVTEDAADESEETAVVTESAE